EEQGNGDGIGIGSPQTLSQSRQLHFRWLLQDPPLGIRPLLNTESQVPADERRHTVEEKVIQARTRLPPDLNDVFKARRRNQRQAGAFPLQQSIGSDSGAVQQRGGFSGAGLSCSANFFQSFGNRSRRIIGRRKHFQSFESAALFPHAVGERTSSVD